MKKVIVFGGSGFLGSYVADELTHRGFSVVVGDKTQIDLVTKNDSGLLDAEIKLKRIKDIGFIYLNDKDVVRHELVRKISNSYE